MKNSIFIAGIHGVGKTTFSKELKSKFNLPHYSASTLIKKFNASLFFADKRVTDVAGNQNVLINSIIQNVTEEFYILDGHFTLMKEDNTIEEIPSSTFEKLHIKKTILLLEEPSIIYQRIANRDKKKILSIDEIDKLQKCELEHAQLVCNNLSIPLVILKNSTEAKHYLAKETI